MQKNFLKNTVLALCAAQFFLPIFSNNFIPSSFDEGMTNFKKYRPSLVAQNWQWQLFHQNYYKFIVQDLEYSKEPRIPKIIHHIWLGSPFPEKCKKLRDTWLKLHPDWEYILWTDIDIEAFGLENQRAYDAATNYGEKSDIARYEILYRVGGLYIDTDFECLKPFDQFHHCCDFYTGLDYHHKLQATLLNGLIASRPGHPILRECIAKIPQTSHRPNEPNAILHRTGPYHFTQCFFAVIRSCSDRVVAFPVNYFYPWPHYDRKENEMKQIRSWIQPESYALHYWHCSWQ